MRLHRDKQTRAQQRGAKPAPLARPTEVCTVCGAPTGVPVDTPVSQRKCYVPGGGQLCEACCQALYHTDDLRTLPEFARELQE